MKTLVILALLSLAACPAFSGTEEFTVVVSGSQAVELEVVYSHFLMVTTDDIEVRFVNPAYGSNGSVSGWTLMPLGGKAADGSGPRPDMGDTTCSVRAAISENIFNDMPGKKLLFTGTGTVTIRAKR